MAQTHAIGDREYKKFYGSKDHAIINVNDVTQSTKVESVSGEAITLAAGAAGTTGKFRVGLAPIMDSVGGVLGSKADTSVSVSGGTTLPGNEIYFNNYTNSTDIYATLDNGDYAVDYPSGTVYYKKADAGTAITISYKHTTQKIDASGATLEVNLDAANDDVLIYGFDGSANQKIATHTDGTVKIKSIADTVTIAGAVTTDVETGLAKDLTLTNRTQVIAAPIKAVGTLVTAQDITLTYTDLGLTPEIATEGYKKLGVWLTAYVNDSETVTLKAVGLHTTAGDEFDIDGITEVSLWTTGASDFKKYYEFEVGAVPIIKLQTKATNLGLAAGYLTGGNNAEGTYGTWESITDAEFAITIDGVPYEIIGIDFTGVGDMAGVATVLQNAIRAETGGLETVVWSTNHFVITSGTTGVGSEVSITSTVSTPAGTDISGAGAADWLDADTGNGTATAGTGVVGNLTVEITKVD